MSKKLVIFGVGDIGQLAHYYFTNDSDYDVAAFTVDKDYIQEAEYCGLPVVAFEDIENAYPPAQYDLCVAVSYAGLNKVRTDKYMAAKSKGYHIPSYVSSHATVLNEGRIGENCFILEDNTIQPFVTIGNNVTLWSGNHIGHHSTIRDNVFIASHIVVSGGVTIEENCFLGVNATLRDHITIGKGCIIAAGACVMQDTPEDTVWRGEFARQSSKPASQVKL